MSPVRAHLFAALAIAALLAASATWMKAAVIGDGPAIYEHVDQQAIDRGELKLQQVIDYGRLLFVAKFNTFDGQSRPGTTGGGASRVSGSAPRFIRTSAPDANSCAGCHNDPAVGGAGDIVANVFVLAQTLDPVTASVDPEFSNERNTLGMHGAGLIEMLAREMTVALHGISDAAIESAKSTGMPVTRQLIAKGVSFGSVTARPDGTVDAASVEGIDVDLIVRPFHQTGVVVSLREFSNNAYNHHHGMQSMERFGAARTGSVDFDQDGVRDELTYGDITAATIFSGGARHSGAGHSERWGGCPRDHPRRADVLQDRLRRVPYPRNASRLGCVQRAEPLQSGRQPAAVGRRAAIHLRPRDCGPAPAARTDA